jgi:hypothetical protein
LLLESKKDVAYVQDQVTLVFVVPVTMEVRGRVEVTMTVKADGLTATLTAFDEPLPPHPATIRLAASEARNILRLTNFVLTSSLTNAIGD